MGLAASQARLLALTARQSDIEYRGQTLNNRRLALTYAMETIANEYSKDMADRKLFMNTDLNTTVPFDQATLNELKFTVMETGGTALTWDATKKAYIDEGGTALSNSEIEQRLRAGTLSIAKQADIDTAAGANQGKLKSGTAAFDWRSDSSGTFSDKYNETNDEPAAAKYEAESAKVQGEDKRLEMELKQLDTQHKAIETEVEAVKKVIDKNVQGSFKTFG